MSEPIQGPELSQLEAALSTLTPAPTELDRDALMFQAGRAAAPRGWFWPAVSGTLATTTAACLLLLALRPSPRVIERIVCVPVPAPTTPALLPPAESVAASTPDDTSLSTDGFRLRQQVLRWGIDALPEPRHALDLEPLATPARLLDLQRDAGGLAAPLRRSLPF